jgi:hypothetical protein
VHTHYVGARGNAELEHSLKLACCRGKGLGTRFAVHNNHSLKNTNILVNKGMSTSHFLEEFMDSVRVWHGHSRDWQSSAEATQSRRL